MAMALNNLFSKKEESVVAKVTKTLDDAVLKQNQKESPRHGVSNFSVNFRI